MHVSRKTFRVEWGDCDPANIVFFPQYLRWFDACTSAMFENAGVPLAALFKEEGIVGIPVVDLKVRFILPSRFGDELLVESKVLEWGRSSFLVEHRLLKDGLPAVECVATHVWTGPDPGNPERLKSRHVPKDVVEKFLF